MKWLTLRVIVFFFISFFAGSARVFGQTDELYRFRSGIHLNQNHRFSNTQLKTLLHRLQFWTGLSEITFDASGNLSLGDRSHVIGGSATARNLIIAAVESQDSFTLERWTSSATIAFAQIEATESYDDGSGGRHNGWAIRLDLSDFVELAGHDEARSSFDPAINVIHELAHAILGYLDVVDATDQLGECEGYINRIRQEVGLPQRLYYYPNYRTATRSDGLTFTQAELRFVAPGTGPGKKKEFYVNFNLDKVFDPSSARSLTTIHADLVAKRTQ